MGTKVLEIQIRCIIKCIMMLSGISRTKTASLGQNSRCIIPSADEQTIMLRCDSMPAGIMIRTRRLIVEDLMIDLVCRNGSNDLILLEGQILQVQDSTSNSLRVRIGEQGIQYPETGLNGTRSRLSMLMATLTIYRVLHSEADEQ